METFSISDGVPCVLKDGDGWIPGILHPLLSSQQMAKVTTEDGSWRDVWWSRVRQCGVPELMDEMDFGEEE